ncbi:hypothetical protein BGW36DRAFT_288499 [Talaromyces proteolyticus]|uniref:Zn(2)-C6 fungal-type domain-containing protein n=1 Tax=Talaromyces proteolyticus TaxID=1131652 RepID=A0AAD4KZU3_9EURO|nr:uncharacterized protein BGW36DRAFT_288499 [Talaromyces proteolyticus]KAH8703643.1 hypothetical protein BGW36DRAFT_288499 [Talaromyces proteolyticus]
MGSSKGGTTGLNKTPKIRSGAARRRQWAPKVRTGCMTCKIRRVKCDETKPDCRRCLSTGRKCDGYEDAELSPPSHRESDIPGSQTTQLVVPYRDSAHHLLSTPSTQHLLPGNETENQYFDFFRLVTTSNLANSFDFGFWSYNILQASHQYPALFHATTAFGSIHRAFLSDTTPATVPRKHTEKNVEFALRQFNKSIRSLSKLLSQRTYTFLDQQVVLTTCILFSCLCILQGRQSQAFMHVNNGLKMLYEWRLNDRSLPRSGSRGVVIDMLMLVFTRLDTQIRPYLIGQEAVLKWTEAPVIPPPTNIPFLSLLEAYVDLEVIFNHAMRLIMNKDFHKPMRPAYIVDQKELISCQLSDWDTRLADFLKNTTLHEREIDQNSLDLVQLRRGFATVLLYSETFRGQHIHDSLSPIYEELLRLSANVLRHTDSTESPSPLTSVLFEKRPEHPAFNLASAITEPLFWTGIRCREPIIRRKALRLLQLYPRREGICEGMLADKIVRTVISIEESNCPRSIEYRQSISNSSSLSSQPSSSSPSSSASSPSTNATSEYLTLDHLCSIQNFASPAMSLGGDKAADLSPCSEEGQWVCEKHRVAHFQYILFTERQLKVVMWTVEDLQLGRDGRSLISSWW